MAHAIEPKTTIRQHINGVLFLSGAVFLAIATFGLLIVLPGALIVDGLSEWRQGALDRFLSRNGWQIGVSALAWCVAIGAASLMARADRLSRDFDKSLRIALKSGAGPIDRDSATANSVAAFLLDSAAERTSGFAFSRVIDEDYGAGFWAHTGAERFWVAVSAASDDVAQPMGRFVVSVAVDPGLSLFARLRSRPDQERHRTLFKAVSAGARSLRTGG